ncbi:MAG: HEAT repeat domain-containing protein [Capsulimonadaceae bacterium]
MLPSHARWLFLRNKCRGAMVLLLAGALLSSTGLSSARPARAQTDVQSQISADIRRAETGPGAVQPAAADLDPMGGPAVTAISQTLSDPKTSFAQRNNLIGVLLCMKHSAAATLPVLVQTATTDPSAGLRATAADDVVSVCQQLGRGAAPEIPAIRHLLTATRDEDSAPCRSDAAQALGIIGTDADPAVPDLTGAMSDPDGDVRHSALGAIAQIAGEYVNQARSPSFSTDELVRVVGQMTQVKTTLETLGTTLADDPQDVDAFRAALSGLNQELKPRQDTAFDNFVESVKTHIVISAVVAYLLGGAILSLLLLWTTPRTVLRICDAVSPITDARIELPNVLGGFTMPLRILIPITFFEFHPRVLDAWVRKHLPAARREFMKKDTVRDRRVYIPVPVILDSQTVAQLSPGDLRPTFAQANGCLLIWEEGGAGKTSLACRIARWAMSERRDERICEYPMIPVLLEHELDFKIDDGKQPLTQAIHGQVQGLLGKAERISDDMLLALLRHRRILVIVDHYSEMGAGTRASIRPGHPWCPLNALIVTSRVHESMDGIPKTVIRPLRIEGNRLSSFMEAYLVHRQKRDLFDDSEYFEACARLSQIVGRRRITVLFAKLYAEQMIAFKENDLEQNMPDNIPDLMLSYLNELNQGAQPGDPDNRIVQRDSKAIAWECLAATYKPSTASKDTIIAVLKRIDGSGDAANAPTASGPSFGHSAQTGLMGHVGPVAMDAVQRLHYYERSLRILHTVPPTEDTIRFSLDPLAEYLAGLHVVETYGANAAAWKKLVLELDNAPDGIESVRGFITALQECCRSKGRLSSVPSFVGPALSNLLPSPADIPSRPAPQPQAAPQAA